ncbi:MAG: hypothetical protein AAGF27_06185 [Pseudomonadota bacterium]
MPLGLPASDVPQGALISSDGLGQDKIAVIYQRGAPLPEITVEQTAGQVQTIMADGVAVAIVACAEGPRLSVDDVVLVERYC